MAITAIATGVAMAIPLAQNYLPENQKDPARFATAEQLYYAARAGDADALCQLKYFSGRFGASPGCGKYGSGTSGFATTVAKQYAFDLYQHATAILSGQLSPASPAPAQPQPGAGTTLPGAGTTLSGISQTTGAAASALGSPPPAFQQRNAAVIIALAFGIGLLFITLRK